MVETDNAANNDCVICFCGVWFRTPTYVKKLSGKRTNPSYRCTENKIPPACWRRVFVIP